MSEVIPRARPRTVGQLVLILDAFQDEMPINPVSIRYIDQTETQRASFKIEVDEPAKMCETCEHYKTDERRPGAGRCMRVEHSTTRELSCFPGSLPDEAVLVDNGDDFAVLRCKPTFGCILHKAKP